MAVKFINHTTRSLSLCMSIGCTKVTSIREAEAVPLHFQYASIRIGVRSFHYIYARDCLCNLEKRQISENCFFRAKEERVKRRAKLQRATSLYEDTFLSKIYST